MRGGIILYAGIAIQRLTASIVGFKREDTQALVLRQAYPSAIVIQVSLLPLRVSLDADTTFGKPFNLAATGDGSQSVS